MTSTSKAELRSPDADQRPAATRWLCGAVVAMMAAALIVEWLHVEDLRQRVVRLEQSCHLASTDTHLLTPLSDSDQPSVVNSRRSAATVGLIMRVTKYYQQCCRLPLQMATYFVQLFFPQLTCVTIAEHTQ